MRLIYQILIICILGHVAKTEYIWDGKEWIWVEKDNNQQTNSRIEGSGDDSIRNNDDEDMEGSGAVSDYDDDDDRLGEDVYLDPDEEEGSGVYVPEVVENHYEPDPTTYRPNYEDPIREHDPITIDGPEPTTTTTTEPPRKSIPDVSQGPKTTNRSTSFFAQPGILAAVVGGAVVGLLCAILFVMFVVYRMRKKDEGSYALDEPKRSPTVNSYSKPPSREFYA